MSTPRATALNRAALVTTPPTSIWPVLRSGIISETVPSFSYWTSMPCWRKKPFTSATYMPASEAVPSTTTFTVSADGGAGGLAAWAGGVMGGCWTGGVAAGAVVAAGAAALGAAGVGAPQSTTANATNSTPAAASQRG